jgi:hypothetical protein
MLDFNRLTADLERVKTSIRVSCVRLCRVSTWLHPPEQISSQNVVVIILISLLPLSYYLGYSNGLDKGFRLGYQSGHNSDQAMNIWNLRLSSLLNLIGRVF